jgi:hypothetical protein
MSPEQLGGKDVDPRSDIHALGVMAYEMLAGEPPYTGPTVTAVAHKVLLEEPRPIADHRRSVPRHVDAAIAKALEKLPADRWQTATEFAEALRSASADSVVPAFSTTRILLPWILAATLAVALGWMAVLKSRPGVPAQTVRFDVEFETGMIPSFTPIVRLSPDGRQLFASAMVNRREEVVRHSFDQIGMEVVKGAGQGEQGTGNSRPRLSPDGSRVSVDIGSADSMGDVWVFERGRSVGTRISAEEGREFGAEWTPDGRWMAYDSDESGGVDVFIQSFPDPRAKRRKVSLGHGSEPAWTRGGRELIYREDDKVVAVDIDMATGESGPPRVLFAGPYPSNQGWTRPRSYDVTLDGQRFLMTRLPGERARPRIRIVMNWFEELRAKVPR